MLRRVAGAGVYRIVFWRGDQQIAHTPYDLGLERAEEHARRYLAITSATLVEVIDLDDGSVVFACSAEANAPPELGCSGD